GLDVLSNVLVAAHGPAIHAEVKRMVFRDRALAQKISGNRDVHSLRHSHYQTSGAIPGQLDPGENDRFLRRANQRYGLAERSIERMRIGFVRPGGSDSGYWNFAINDVVGNFDVNRTFVAQTGLDAANDLRGGALLIEQDRARNRDFVVNAPLRLESFDLMMEKRVFFTIFSSGSATHNHNGRFLGVCASDGI